MSFSLHHSQQFKVACDQEGLQAHQPPQLPVAPHKQLPITNALTQDYYCFLYQYLARNQPQDLPKHDISFQKNFLDQHIKTIEAILQNSEESILISPQQLKLADQEANISKNLSKPSKISFLSFLQVNQLATQLVDTDQLIKDLQREHDLAELISYFINNLRREVAIGLVSFTADIWSNVRKLKFRQLQTHDVQRISEQWVKLNAQKYLQRPDSKAFIHLFKGPKAHLSQISAEQNFADRLIIFCTTLLLVVGGFFQNPYADGELPPLFLSEADYPKRQSPCSSFRFQSDSQFFSESEEEGEPQKKRKRF